MIFDTILTRKRRHDAENHVHICALHHSGESLQNGQQPQGNRLGKKFQFESPRMKLRRNCQQLGLCLFPPCYFIFLEPCQVRGISVFFVLFTLAFTTGYTSSGSLPFIGCFVLFSQFILVYFIICKKENSFVRSSSIDQRFRGLPGLGFGVGLVTGSCHSLFFLFACPFVSRGISFIYDV